jgi:cell division protein FtsN
MEQKRTLWIVAAVGIFLLAVLGAALILYSPVRKTDSVVTTFDPDSETWIKPNTISQLTQTEAPSKNQQKDNITNNTTDMSNNADTITTLPLSENTGTAPSTLAHNSQTTKDLTVYSNNTTVVTSSDGTTTVNLAGQTLVPTTKTEITTQKPTTDTKTEVTQPVATTQTTAIAQKVSNVQTTPVTTITNKKSVNTSKTITQKTPSKPADAYWVQAASYTNKTNADAARDTLLAEEIPGEVFTYTSNGVTYYRLRIGAYTTKSEAEYWRERIQLIDEFAKTQSYVTNSSLPASK